ncbi:MAG: hypothetical protein ACI959_000703, partial [Limisphaerales bacterium]
AIAHLSSVFGVSSSRFIMKYQGEGQTLYNDARAESQHQVNRRVEFKAVQSGN